MRASLLALLAFAMPLRATDVGIHLEFAAPIEGRIAAPAGLKSGAVAWESGPSAAVGGAFAAILLQGRLGGSPLRVEASVDGGPWIPANGERSSDGRFWSRAEASGRKGAIVRLRALGGGPESWIEIFGVYASDQEEERPASGALRLQSAPRPVTLAYAAPKPPVEPRAAWGALPAARPYELMTPERISIHHTEAPQPMSRELAVLEMQAIQRFHQKGRGWIDIAYQFLIDGGGRIWEGRPLSLVGAHVKDKNDGNVGISLMGDFSPGRQKPTAAQIKSLIALTRWLSETYAIPAERIKGHRDQEITACPGKALYARLDEVRHSATAPSGLYAAARRAASVMEEPAW